MIVDSRRPQYTSASELAQMAVCERQVWLRARMGARKTAHQAAAADWGIVVHDRIHRSGHNPIVSREPAQDKRCFIATAVYGTDAPETLSLRQFRDEVLKRSAAGTCVIELYYLISPGIARFIETHQGARKFVKCVLDSIVKSIK